MKTKHLKLLSLVGLLGISLPMLSSCGEDYYSKIDASLEGEKLQSALHELLLDTHKTYTKYSEYNSYITSQTNPRSIDENPNNSKHNILFYTGDSYSKNRAGSYNIEREHVWPCANSNGLWTHDERDPLHCVDNAGYAGAGSDLFAVRPCNGEVNEARSNSKFYEFPADDNYHFEHRARTDSPYALLLDCEVGTTLQASKCEPAKEYKGDIARILMYIYVHYNNFHTDKENEYVGDLDIKDACYLGYSRKQVYDMLIRWNNIDPVDEHEKLRNKTVYAIQGNKNPFVDHPEYAAKCFTIEG